MLDRFLRISASLLLLPLLAGCPQVQNIRMVQDTPGDIENLLEQQEFARVRNLTTRHPEIDTRELQDRITNLESAYEQDMFEQARALEDSNELLGAVDLLSEALRRIPHSGQLRELRTTIESRRTHQLKVNERNSLTARAEYLLDVQRIYQQQVNLQPPNFEQRREFAQYEKERIKLSQQLLEHARYAIDTRDNGAADTCLSLARALDEGADTAALSGELRAAQETEQESARQAANTRNARIKRINDREDQHETKKLLATTQQALSSNKLQDARDAFTKIPPSTSKDSEVIAVQNTLDQAVSTRVRNLIVTGDAQYRAENIHEALKTWSEALALDPGNIEVRERTDRANKVLANLEELKRQQGK